MSQDELHTPQFSGDYPVHAPLVFGGVNIADTSAAPLAREAVGAVLAGAGLGVVADPLLRARAGVNVAVMVLVVIAARLAIGRFCGRALPRRAALLYLGALLAALGMAWRDAPILRTLNAAVCLAMLVLAAVSLDSISHWGMSEYFSRLLGSAGRVLKGAYVSSRAELLWLRVPRLAIGGNASAVLRGGLLLLPFLLVFGGLLASADAQFEKLVRRLFDWDTKTFLLHVVWILVFAWLGTGYLLGTFDDAQDKPGQGLITPSRPFTIGGIEAAVVLGGLNALFLTFLLLQFGYLFGGASHVKDTVGLTLAFYARRGFFELVLLATLVLGLLWSGEWILRREHPAAERWFRGLAFLMVAMVFCIMASAMHRMWIYMQSFGLTELRLYTSAFMVMLAAVFVWFGATVLAGRRERFVTGVVVIGFVSLLGLEALNPDAQIARESLERFEKGRPADISYLSKLSLDAVPVVAAHRSKLDAQLTKWFQSAFAQRIENRAKLDWRSWNWSFDRAANALTSSAPAGSK